MDIIVVFQSVIHLQAVKNFYPNTTSRKINGITINVKC